MKKSLWMSFYDKLLHLDPYGYFAAFVISALGILFRITQYWHNRSLWLDEGLLAKNLIDRTFQQLLLPLDYNQASPIGFLFAVKFVTKIFGIGEYFLRLIPLISGILIVLLFFFLARQLFEKNMALVAQFLVCFSPALIYYSSEFKQYSSDALICLALFTLAVLYEKRNGKLNIGITLGLFGAAAVWFSYPAIFFLAGIGLTLAAYAILRKDGKQILMLLFIGALWFASFGVLYFVSLRLVGKNQVLEQFWAAGFAPFPPRSADDWTWYLNTLLGWFSVTARIPLSGLALFCFILGASAFYQQNREVFLFILLPIPFIVAASIFHQYPIMDRLMTFIIPFLLLGMIKGIEYLKGLLTRYSLPISLLLIALISIYPTGSAIDGFRHPSGREEIRPAIQYARQNWREGDIIFVSNVSSAPFDYYARIMKIPRDQYEYEKQRTQDLNVISQNLNDLKGQKRVWFLFSHMRGNELSAHLYVIQKLGKEIQSYQAQDAAVYLFDLSNE